MPTPRTQLGIQGEEKITQYLIERGYVIIARNVRWRGGEIDIIALQHQVVACIEVKTRKTNYFPLSTVVTPTKQRKIILTAQYFIACHPELHNHTIRFDIALVEQFDTDPNAPDWRITYLTNAFTAPDTY